ncbi:unnamed protein product, partial [Lymnaea stagnalis]
EFKYLGSYFVEDGEMDREIETRGHSAKAVSYQIAPLLRHPRVKMKTKPGYLTVVLIEPLLSRVEHGL